MSEFEATVIDATTSFTDGTEVLGDVSALGHPAMAEMIAARAAEAEQAAQIEKPAAIVTAPLDYVVEM